MLKELGSRLRGNDTNVPPVAFFEFIKIGDVAKSARADTHRNGGFICSFRRGCH
jgi:hypothetical protein